MKKKMNTKKGFTLVEIIVVLVIVAIMAGFAIPAYTGFIARARESQVLGDARVLLLAAQTAGQERYSLKGAALTTAADATLLVASINSLAGLSATSRFTVTYSPLGIVTAARIFNGTYYATYASGSWTTSSTGTVIAANAVTVV